MGADGRQKVVLTWPQLWTRTPSRTAIHRLIVENPTSAVQKRFHPLTSPHSDRRLNSGRPDGAMNEGDGENQAAHTCRGAHGFTGTPRAREG